ncbi:Hypothetical_protein [Hexamita inflata]|uniref:Hypothetical_protein n=1 Tax=Hexamita inflata TaxID=28002 RepID=A0ABP1HBR9_9EUKA
MYKSFTNVLLRLQQLLQFNPADLTPHRDDTPLTHRWLWALTQLSQNLPISTKDLQQLQFSAETQLKSSVYVDPNMFLNEIIMSFPIQIQELFFFTYQCPCTQTLRAKYSTVLNTDISTASFTSNPFQQSLQICPTCKRAQLLKFPSVYALANNLPNITDIPLVFTVQDQKYALVQLTIQSNTDFLTLTLHETQTHPDAIIKMDDKFVSRGVGQSFLKKPFKNEKVVYMFYVNLDVLDELTKTKLENCAKCEMMTNIDDEEIIKLKEIGRKVEIEVANDGIIKRVTNEKVERGENDTTFRPRERRIELGYNSIIFIIIFFAVLVFVNFIMNVVLLAKVYKK